MLERPPLIEINVGKEIRAVTFTRNGEYLVSADKDSVRVWRVEDGKQMATMEARNVLCLAVSTDDRWIAAGTLWDRLFIWNAKTYEKVLERKEENNVHALDFSPDSTRLVVTTRNRTATVWDVVARRRVVGPFNHGGQGKGLTAAKYSPRGDQIATATTKSICVWDSSNGHLLIDIPVLVNPWYNTGLLWLDNHLFVISDNKIKEIDASAGLSVSEWLVPDTNRFSCVALPEHGEVIAYCTNHIVTFWDMSTHTRLCHIEHDQDILSIAFSSNDQFIALGGVDGKVTIRNLSHISIPIPLSRPHPTFEETDIQIEVSILDAWKNDRLEDAKTLLSTAISASQGANHHLLGCLALIRARLGLWDVAIADAEMSIKTQPSVFGYIAKSIALIGKGEKLKGYRTYDIAFERFHTAYPSFLLLIKAILVFIAGDHDDAISRMDDLTTTTLHFNSLCYVVQAYMYFLLGISRMECRNYEGAVQSFECAKARLRPYVGHRLFTISMMTGWKFDDLYIRVRQNLCDALYATGRVQEGADLLLDMLSTVGDEVYTNGPLTEWISKFARGCLCPFEGGESSTGQQGSARATHPIVTPETTKSLLLQWVKATLGSLSWKDVLVSADFTVSRSMIYRAVCERLQATNCIVDASDCFIQLLEESKLMAESGDEQVQWVLDFKRNCSEKLISLGDAAMGAGQYEDAVSRYSVALSLSPALSERLLIQRSKAHLANGSWDNALDDANKLILLNPSSPWGYERKHAALLATGNHDNAIDAFDTMLLKISESSDVEIRTHRLKYVNPKQTSAAIRKAVRNAIRDSPRMLINTASGRLCDKLEQAAAFESLPVFKELISSMTTQIDHARIEHHVADYYRYATFSHKWDPNEPLFDKVIGRVVYDLEESLTHHKLQMLCKVAQGLGFHWVWSDTCCINKADHFILQEALVAMFKWYEGSATTIVFLRGAHKRGDLVGSIWNTRAWTLQEYHASKVVRFYKEDWTPYLDPDIPNHKLSPEIISDMEEATRVSARALMALRPGLGDIREKLCLASQRETTFVEDAAYSLLGIFSVSLPVVYGEGDKALGRLLAQLLTSSGDVSILAWTGSSGSFNSCLPTNIVVFGDFPALHFPRSIENANMEAITSRLQVSSPNFALATKLYTQLGSLPVAFFMGQRLKLPCITFALGSPSAYWNGLEYVFRAKAAGLGVVEIRTSEDLSKLDSLTLVHPWIDFLLDRKQVGSTLQKIPAEELPTSDLASPSSGLSDTPKAGKQGRKSHIISRLGQSFGSPWPRSESSESLVTPAPTSLTERRVQILRLLARLREPFGALLFTPIRRNVAEFRRVAADSVIHVRIPEDMPLEQLIENARVLDVL